jgi:tRNA-splicing ligase RtcB
MDIRQFKRVSDYEWQIPRVGAMRVPGVLYADGPLVQDMDQKVFEQMVNVATLPGIVKASFAMPDAHWGYGFPIGGVAAFDPHEGGVVSAGGVGFDISCGVRNLRTGLTAEQILEAREPLANELYRRVPAGVGSTGTIRLNAKEMDAMLVGGAGWAVSCGWGLPEDLDRIEEGGSMEGALPQEVSEHAKKRQRDEMGTLGSGNHYLEVQKVEEVFDEPIADRLGVHVGDAIVSIHCGSRGLGHQIGTDFLRRMTVEAPKHGLRLPDRELASAPLDSDLGEAYLGAMRAGINCALANREIITHWVRQAFEAVFPGISVPLLYDVSHNTCKLEEHQVNGARKKLYVHRKGATRAWGPGHPGLPPPFRETGQPVLIGGTMGTNSYILVGSRESMDHAFGSSCHGAGRAMSRHQALKMYRGRDVVDRLAREGVLVKSPSWRGVAEEAPGAYKDVSAVVKAAQKAGLSKRVAKLRPMICIKG